MKISAFLFCIFFPLAPMLRGQDVKLSKVDLIHATPNDPVFILQDGEAAVGGSLIKRVEIGKSTAVVTYLNKTASSKQPKYTFRLFNAYGMEVAEFEDKWMLQTIKTGETQKEDKDFLPVALDRVLQFSGIHLPDDWASPIYLMIGGMRP
jgi:hypothetical protein